MDSSTPLSSYQSLSAVLRALRGEVGGWEVRRLFNHVLALLLYRRLGEICGQIERLAARFQTGRLLRRPSRAVSGGPRRAGGARLWPRRFGWLVKAAAYQAAGYGSQLREILQQPQMVDLLQATPQAARILRPVCRMLAVENALLQPGVVVPEPAPREVKPRQRKPRPPIDWGRIPLPRGVLTAVRERRFCIH
ncbi:MAG: hypothetical protein P4L66_06725 [Acetobacteraceae bacterium]|nr:hypothetical protein [Acetobacteraceae bacterium]